MGNKATPMQVFRAGAWREVPSDDLLPGDILSLRHVRGQNTVVPCDCLVLRGSAVANESTLTGESVPQLKGALTLGACVCPSSPPAHHPPARRLFANANAACLRSWLCS
jgi:P-type E1-E2 ATPase